MSDRYNDPGLPALKYRAGTHASFKTRMLAMIGDSPALARLTTRKDDDPTVAVVVLEAGAAGFVLKRSAATDLVPAVHEVLRGGLFVSPSVRRNRDGINSHDPAGRSEEK